MSLIYGILTKILGFVVDPAPQPLLARSRRGAGLLEYALVLLLSIGIFIALNALFPGIFRNLANRIGNLISGQEVG